MSTQAMAPLDLESSPRYSRGVVISLLLHAALLAFFTIKNFVSTDEIIDYKQAIRVDIVGLPDKLKPEDLDEKPKTLPPKPIPPAPPVKKVQAQPKVEPPKPKPVPLPPKVDKEAINLDQAKLKQKEALQKLKSQSAIDEIQQQLEREKKVKAAAAKPPVVKGNVIAPGSELTGLDKIQNENYETDIDHHVKKYWELPAYFTKKGYKTQVSIHIDEKGNVTSREILKTSGNPSYDDLALAAVDRANPMPAPPAKLAAKVRVNGIVIEFEE